MKNIKIALVGQPNVGKSMLVNSMGNSTLHVGNFTGVTVEKKMVDFVYKDYNIHIVDLPGTYMLNDYSQEERVTNDFLRDEEFDIILNVVDSTNLQRNLQLTSELLNLDTKMVIALNMSDEAIKENIYIDEKYMSELLGVHCIKVSALKKDGIKELLDKIISTYTANQKESKLIFSEAIEEEIENVIYHLEQNKFISKYSSRKLAIGLLSEDKTIYNFIHDEPIWTTLQDIVSNSIKHIKIHNEDDAIIDIFAEEFMAFNNGIIKETVMVKNVYENKKTLTQKIDDILIHPLFGIPIFLFFMWGLFQLTFEIGSIPMDFIDAGFSWFKGIIGATIANNEIRSLVVDGVISGVGAVVLFVPNIIILFIGIALLESTGYMSRVAYLLDGFFHKFGLHGQSFIPLVTGFGCSIPAYMSARILKNDQDRLLTLFIIGFMSCGARLPVYVLFVGAFFAPHNAGNILFGIYLSGTILGLILAKVLKMTAFKGHSEPFVMEMPKYRMPSFALIWHTVKSKTLMYLKKAGTFIAAASMLVWFSSNYPKNIDSSKNNISQEKILEQSYLGQIGKFIEPVFQPLGMDWKMAVALQTGLAAKEVVVSTLGVLYSLENIVDETNSSLKNRLSNNISFASAIAFIIIIMTYLPCLAATIVFAREAGGVKYAFYLFIFTTIVAYTLAFIGYNIAL